MNPIRLFLPFLLFTGAALAQSGLTWDFSQSTGRDAAVETADGTGQFTLVFATGATVVADAAAPGGQVLILDGTQAEPGQTARASAPWPAVEISLRLKPAGQGGDRQTVIAFGNAYEVRYVRNRGVVEFIVFHPERKFTIAQVKAAAGAWHDVRAVFRDGRLRLTVGATTAEQTLPAGAAIDPRGTRIRVGRQADRAFVGALASLSIRAP